MNIVLDADLLSTIIRVKREDLLNSLFHQIIIPQSVVSELRSIEITAAGLNCEISKLSREELLELKKSDPRFGKGERECLAIAKIRKIPLGTNDKLVQLECKAKGIDFVSLPRLLRLAISERTITLKEARKLVLLIEREERTTIKNVKEVFK